MHLKKLKPRHCVVRTKRWWRSKTKVSRKAMPPYSCLWKWWIQSTSIQKIERIEGTTPYESWSCLFTDAMFHNLVKQTQLYANRDNGNHNFYLTTSDIYQFIGIFLFSRYHKVPKEREYWSSQIDLHMPFFANAMTRNIYL